MREILLFEDKDGPGGLVFSETKPPQGHVRLWPGVRELHGLEY
jgi:hypothetical protein